MIISSTITGYTGEISAAIAGIALLLLGIVSLVLYRNWRYEQELDSLLWKVDFKEIQMHENDKENTGTKQTRVSSFSPNRFLPFPLGAMIFLCVVRVHKTISD